LESGEALDDNFRAMAADEIERFRRDIIECTGDARQAENLTDQDLLREAMNTVGKPGRLVRQHLVPELRGIGAALAEQIAVQPLSRNGLRAHHGRDHA